MSDLYSVFAYVGGDKVSVTSDLVTIEEARECLYYWVEENRAEIHDMESEDFGYSLSLWFGNDEVGRIEVVKH